MRKPKLSFESVISFHEKFQTLFSREHAAELNNPVPPMPILFMKPPSCYIKDGQAVEVIYKVHLK